MRQTWMRTGLLVALIAISSGCATGGARPRAVVATGALTPGARLVVLPAGVQLVSVRGTRYYVHRGVFYRPRPGGYIVVAAPIGAVVRSLPADARVVTFHGRRYHRWHDTWYRYDPERRGYVVVRP